MEALGTEGFAAARVAALATREAKEQVDLPRLREEWKARAAEHGLGRRELDALVARAAARSRARSSSTSSPAALLGRDGLTAKQTTFTMPELVQAVAGSLPRARASTRCSRPRTSCRASPASSSSSRRRRRDGRRGSRPASCSQVEREAVELALAGRDVAVPAPERRPLAEALMQSGHGLTGEQRMLVHEAATRPDRVVCVVGVAGAGKTLALRALADAYRDIDVAVLGAAPSGRAADELADRDRHPQPHPAPAPPRRPSRRRPPARLRAGRRRGRDGRDARARPAPPRSSTGRRASCCWSATRRSCRRSAPAASTRRSATASTRSSSPTTAASATRSNAKRSPACAPATPSPTSPTPLAAAASPSTTTRSPRRSGCSTTGGGKRAADPARNVMLAYRRADVDELNQAAHALMLRQRRLGREAVTLGEREFRVGDQVLCRRNDSRLGLRNGMRGTIVDLDDDARRRSRPGTAPTDTSPFGYAAEHLDYGYALTGHAAQGAHRRPRLRPPPRPGRPAGVGLRRLQPRPPPDPPLPRRPRPARTRDTRCASPSRPRPSERAARALQRSAAEPLALDQRRQRRDTILNFLAQQQEQLDRNRQRTLERLAAARRELEHLHWWNRDRRAELETEIALHRQALGRADESTSSSAKRSNSDTRADNRSRARRDPRSAETGTDAPQSRARTRATRPRARTLNARRASGQSSRGTLRQRPTLR